LKGEAMSEIKVVEALVLLIMIILVVLGAAVSAIVDALKEWEKYVRKD
jgi:archaellum biogenesis protein FlaJ (TadC family)